MFESTPLDGNSLETLETIRVGNRLQALFAYPCRQFYHKAKRDKMSKSNQELIYRVLPYATLTPKDLEELYQLGNTCWQQKKQRGAIGAHDPVTAIVTLALNPQPVGFCISETLSTSHGPVYYLDNIAILPNQHGKGIAIRLICSALLYCIQRSNPWAAFARTQNPHLEKAFRIAVHTFLNWQECVPIRRTVTLKLTEVLVELIENRVLSSRFPRPEARFDPDNWIYYAAYGNSKGGYLTNQTLGDNGKSFVNWKSEEGQYLINYLQSLNVELSEFLSNGNALMIGTSRY